MTEEIIFNAIKSFISDLNGCLNKKNKPLALYNRLFEKTGFTSTFYKKNLSAFKGFFEGTDYMNNKDKIMSTRINYTDRIFIDFKQIEKNINSTAKKQIHKHLMTIYALIYSETESGKKAVENLKEEELDLNFPDTVEGNFVKTHVEKVKNELSKLDIDEENASIEGITSKLLQSGFISDFMKDFDKSIKSGQINVQQLLTTTFSVLSTNAGPDMGSMLGTLTSILPTQIITPSKVEEINEMEPTDSEKD